MKRFTFIIFVSVFCLGLMHLSAEAALVTNNGCEGVVEISDPLDSHTESRFARYIQTGGEPRTFESEEQYQRWCKVWNDNEELRAVRYSIRDNLRNRSLEERFYKIRDERQIIDFTTDLELKDLSPSRQVRVLQRVKNENCDPGSQSEDELIEYAICKRLIEEKDAVRKSVINNKRLDIRILRAPDRIQSAVEHRRLSRIRWHTQSSVSPEIQPIAEKEKVQREEFDPGGEGSVALSESVEMRVRYFAERENCIRLASDEQKKRCAWLVQFNRIQKQDSQDKVIRRIRRAGISEDFRVRRGVQRDYRSVIGTIGGVIQQRRLEGGFRPTPRTIQEAQQNYQSPVTIEGD